jgi:hypothetical protein
MSVTRHPIVQELLQSMRLGEHKLLWPTESYRQWLDRLSHSSPAECTALLPEMLSLAFRIRRELPEDTEDVITKLYTCVSLLQQHGGEQAADPSNDPPPAEGGIHLSPVNSDDPDDHEVTDGPSLHEWFVQRRAAGEAEATQASYEDLAAILDLDKGT